MLKPNAPRGMSPADVERYEQPAVDPLKRDVRMVHAAKPAKCDDPAELELYVAALVHQQAAVKGVQDGQDHGSWAHEPVLQTQGVVVLTQDRLVEKLPAGVDPDTALALSKLPLARQQQILKAAAAADK